MLNYLSLIDTDTPGSRCDVTPLFANFEAFSALVEGIFAHFRETEFDYAAGIDALGFILGTAVAMRAKKGFISIRKGGKLPVETRSVQFVDYTGLQKSLEIRPDMFPRGARILLVDEWIETGTQVNAAIELIENQQCEVVGIAAINIDGNAVTNALIEKYNCYAAWMPAEG